MSGERHDAVRDLLITLQPNPRLDGMAADISVSFADFAEHMASLLKAGPELTAGLRKLREAKDCLIIQALIDTGVIHG